MLMYQLLQLLEEMVESLDEDTNQIPSYADSLYNIYNHEDFRHSYAELSKFLENKLVPDQRDRLVEVLDNILIYIDNCDDQKYFQKNIVLRKIGKLADHMELEKIRLTRIEGIIHIGDKVSKECHEAEENVKSSKKLFVSMSRSLRNTNAQIVTVLGIFAGIVIAVFGGLTFFSSVFNNIEKVGNFKLVFITGLTGFTLFNVIAFMLAVIAYFIDKPFPLLGFKSDGSIGRRQFYKKAYTFVNIIFILVLVIDVVLWILK